MKDILALSVLVMSLSVNYAQPLVPFPPAGLVQGEIKHGDWTAPGEFDATFMCIADTVIGGTTYNRFKADYLNTFYTRYDNGKVYFVYSNWDGSIGSEYILYDFTLTLGQTFVSAQLGNCVVDSVSTITLLNGEVRKYMRLDGYDGQYVWVDGIGDIERGFRYYSDFEGGHVDFVCHTDATGLIYQNNNVSYDCDSLTNYSAIGIQENRQGSFGVYPNPANGELYLKGDFRNQSFVELTITDLSGKIFLNSSSQRVNEAVNVSLLAPGIYTCTVFDGQDFYTSRVIITN